MMSKIAIGKFRIILIACFLSLVATGMSLAVDYLEYPGNGFPIFSKNKPIKDLNDEIQRQTSSYSNMTFSQGRMNFKAISGFRFTSSKSLIGPRYCLHVPLSINDGFCTIVIGDVSYSIGQEGFKVTKENKVVFESKKEKPINLIIEVFSSSNSSTRFHDMEKQIGMVPVSFSEPASISISLDSNCSGWIGPWEWLRGYE